MTQAKRTNLPATKRAKAKRGQGRPVVGENDVGQDRLVAAAEKLLRQMPPARVTIALIAREASVDPALVRYYFGNRMALLLAVADRITNHSASHAAQPDAVLEVGLADHIRKTLKLTRSAPFMHRLFEELADSDDDAARGRVRTMNLDLVAYYRRMLKSDAGTAMASVNPLFLHLMVLGASDFFASAEPMIRELVPSNTNMDKLAAGYQEFLVKMVMEGLRKA